MQAANKVEAHATAADGTVHNGNGNEGSDSLRFEHIAELSRGKRVHIANDVGLTANMVRECLLNHGQRKLLERIDL